MKQRDFKELLLRASFCVMASDGEVAASEVQELQKMIEFSPYFDGLEHERLLKKAQQELEAQGGDYLKQFLSDLAKESLSETQEFLMLEALLRMIMADDKVEEGEVQFLQQLCQQLKHFDEKKRMLRFPKYLHVFGRMGQEEFGSSQVGEIDLSAWKDLDGM